MLERALAEDIGKSTTMVRYSPVASIAPTTESFRTPMYAVYCASFNWT